MNIGADTYPLHETRLSMVGGHHVAGDVRGDVVNLLVRFRVMNIGKALLRWSWETVLLTVKILTLSGKLRTLASRS